MNKTLPPIYHLEKLAPDDFLASHINIALSGFKRQSLVSPEEVAEFLALFPRHHLEGLRRIEFKPLKSAPSIEHFLLGKFKKKFGGRFYSKDKKIVVTGTPDREQFFYTLCHELGHFVYFHVIGSFLKKEWVTKIYKSTGFVTLYAGRNGAEDFAECYAHYALQKPIINQFPAKKQFLLNNVFKQQLLNGPDVERLLSQKADQHLILRL